MRDSMTDALYPPPAITSHDHAPSVLSQKPSYPDNQRNGVSPMDDAHEDDGQISCFCGFADDDGNTVACDLCNRWQHTTCYYPQYDGRDLPDELQHFCVECRPKPFNAEAARARQQQKRDRHHSLSNGTKRQVTKSHKKKVKDQSNTTLTNGWPLDKARHDRNSASPRDQPPPAKRPKTSHRPSESISKPLSRKRNASVANNRSSSQSPDRPSEYYSSEYLRTCKDDDWAPADANLYNDIKVTNKLSQWLHMSDEDFQKEHGQGKGDLLMRWDGDLDDIPGKAQIEIMDGHDLHENPELPSFKAVTVKEPVASGAYIGELRGHVGFTAQYKEDPSNRWASLRHPEPFVFLHPSLHIYVDARNEGTDLRYVRRSCRPNAKLQVLITDSTNYHFCFMATEEIHPGMEVAVAWDTQDSIYRASNGISSKEMDHLSTWVSNVLANCGPCACNINGIECFMARFDRRGRDDEPPLLKVPKTKRKKANHHVSPLNTHTVNSRSGSEVRRGDGDDEPTDSRSVSGSGGGSASRDITPNTHYSANGSLSNVPELSERERKKLAKEEEMFKRQEEERTGRQGKKKRSSAGSNLNTPSATSTSSAKQVKYTDSGTARQSGLPAKRPGRPKGSSSRASANRASKVVPLSKPVYVDADTQCDMDQEDAEERAAQRAAAPVQTYISTTQRLLQRCALNNSRRKVSASPPKSSKSADDDGPMDLDSKSVVAEPEQLKENLAESESGTATPPPAPSTTVDTQMEDVDDDGDPTSHQDEETNKLTKAEREPTSSSPVASHPSSDPAGPLWQSKASPGSDTADATPAEGHKPTNMHVSMPPPATVGWITSAAAHSSPMSLNLPTLVFSPSVTAAVQPSPMRKKLSLSDYTKRSKAKDKPERDGSPASVASGPTGPPLQASASDMQREGSQAIEEEQDVKMEDVTDGISVAVPPVSSTGSDTIET
ncbi:Hypothetical protein R9X50_00235900 [Acrodontium crateriforme]|uniref:Zinc finger PHD-type domain-containing protein n=1 Tax=Acrodontium crateriforme TaxID=150365 RepID=A0AAQ3M3R0_9PEZI|nr:Hypothetical protein R9X50_00235900 [Acrodontium crateriforme]